jgi:hypothetical protein
MTSLCALMTAGFLAIAAVATATPIALPARTISLSETAYLHPTSMPTLTINEEGSASGTIKGTIYIHLHLTSSRDGVTAEVNIYPHGGSLSGHGSASYQVEGADAVFSGKLSITQGSGSYAQARATSLRFTGSIQRRTYDVTVRLSGPLSV